MKLVEVQRRMIHATLQPLTNSDQIATQADAAFIKPSRRLSAAERLEIYSRGYRFRLLDSLHEDFPGLRAVLGEPHSIACRAPTFQIARPARSRCAISARGFRTGWRATRPMREKGKPWPSIWRYRSGHTSKRSTVPPKKILDPEDLLELGPGFRAGLQPHVRLLALRFPVDDLRIQVNQGTKARIRASRLTPARIFVAVYRLNDSVYYRRLEPEEYRLLDAIRRGQRIEDAISRALENRRTTMEQDSMIEKWFALWAEIRVALSKAVRKNKVNQ